MAPPRSSPRRRAAALAAFALLGCPPAATALQDWACPAADAPAPLPCYSGYSGTYFRLSQYTYEVPVFVNDTANAWGGLCARASYRCTQALRALVLGLNAYGYYTPAVPPCEVGTSVTMFIRGARTSFCEEQRQQLALAALPGPLYVPGATAAQNTTAAGAWQAARALADATDEWLFCDTPLCNAPPGASSGAAAGPARAHVAPRAAAAALLAAAAGALAAAA
jgi:hypothetical protein